MNILDTLVAATRHRIMRDKGAVPPDTMHSAALAAKARNGGAGRFAAALAAPGMSFICEVKKASPSKGLIAPDFDPLATALDYEAGGAAAISVLTETDHFLGSDDYLREISTAVAVPTLRKDFVVEAYQIAQAKTLGASAVLLICAILPGGELGRLLEAAEEYGLDALVEAHDEAEIGQALAAGAKIIGVNNRDLRSFRVDTRTSIRLRGMVPEKVLFVSESGIATAEDVAELREAGVDAVLVGETLMRSEDRAAALEALRGKL